MEMRNRQPYSPDPYPRPQKPEIAKFSIQSAGSPGTVQVTDCYALSCVQCGLVAATLIERAGGGMQPY
ncbi:hypothetical protein BKA66DRAFT_471135, partial [Pyrenochaeta sp. MPI-SDFR-AT-0127]